MRKNIITKIIFLTIFLTSCTSNQSRIILEDEKPQNLIEIKENILETISEKNDEILQEDDILEDNILEEIVSTNPSKEVTYKTNEKKSGPLDKFVNYNNLKYSNISFYAVDLNTQEVIGNFREESALIPASVMKVVTAATALEVFGPNKTLDTKVVTDGKIINGVLNGNLYILGSGDPTLGSDRFPGDREIFLKTWLLGIKKAGINSINGDIIVVDDKFGYEGVPGTWLWEDMGTQYAPANYGVSIFDNTYTAYLTSGAPGTTPKVTKVTPNIKGLSFDNHSVVSSKGKNTVSIRGVPLNNKRRIFGEVPSNRSDIPVKSDIPNPGLFLGEYFMSYLKQNGISVKGKAVTSKTTSRKPNQPRVLATHKSPPMSEIIKVLLTKSDNHYTEAIFQLLTKDEKINIVKFWKDKGIDVGIFDMSDGSGLSRKDVLSSKFLVEILVYMDTKSNSKIKYEKLFPIAGKDGTVANFLSNTSLSKKAKIKSGSMNGVQSYSGYIEKNGQRYAFSIIVNHWKGSRNQLKAEISNLLNELF